MSEISLETSGDTLNFPGSILIPHILLWSLCNHGQLPGLAGPHFPHLSCFLQPGILEYTCRLSPWEAGAGTSGVQG